VLVGRRAPGLPPQSGSPVSVVPAIGQRTNNYRPTSTFTLASVPPTYLYQGGCRTAHDANALHVGDIPAFVTGHL
jgi:hypothetical protein